MAVFIAGLLATAGYILSPAAAQLSGTVGPTTSSAAKAAVKVCSILDYGGQASATFDNGAAIQAAWDACKSGGQVYIPEGDYGLSTFVTLKNGVGVSINLEGTIYRLGSAGGNMIFIRNSNDFEFYSATSAGAIQGYGYEYHLNDTYGPRLLRLYECTDYSVHDIALVDSPAFHLSLDTTTNGEIYNMIIRGGNEGGLDGIDVWGSNIWIHDIEVTNKDECVTVKDPSDHILVEQVHCNWSGGCAMGSLSSGIDIHDIEYNNIYTHHSNQMYMVKSNGGSGTVTNVALNNFSGHSNAYSLDFDSAWSSMSVVTGDGIQYSNFSFSGWKGTAANGVQRGPIKMNCPAKVPCTDMTIEDFNMWTETGSSVLYTCANAYGTGACLKDGTGTSSYTTTQTITTATSYAYSTMSGELTAGLGLSTSIAIPAMPSSFFPGKQPISAILGGVVAAAVEQAVSTSTSVAVSTTSSSVPSSTSTVSATKTPSSSASKTSSFVSSIVAAITSTPKLTTSAGPITTSSSSSSSLSPSLASARRPGCGRKRSQS